MWKPSRYPTQSHDPDMNKYCLDLVIDSAILAGVRPQRLVAVVCLVSIYSEERLFIGALWAGNIEGHISTGRVYTITQIQAIYMCTEKVQTPNTRQVRYPRHGTNVTTKRRGVGCIIDYKHFPTEHADCVEQPFPLQMVGFEH